MMRCIAGLVALVVTLGLSGCAIERLNKGLNSLMGSHESALFQALGYPDGQQKIGDDTVYVWGFAANQT